MCLKSVGKWSRRRPAEVRGGSCAVGLGSAYVTARSVVALDPKRLARDALGERKDLGHRRLVSAADVVNPTLFTSLHRCNRPGHRIVDVREAARCGSVAIERKCAAGSERFEDPRKRHIRTLSRTVNGEISKANRVEAGIARICVREVLATALR